jgi:hypothetical protein
MRRKLYHTRAAFARASALLESGSEYVIRTYREGKYIRNYVRGLRRCQSRKSWRQMLVEIAQVAWKWKILPFNYFRNALYDRTTPYNERFLAFMPEPVLFTRFMPVLSPPDYRILVHNKYFFHELLQAYGIPAPELVAWSFSRTLYGHDGVIRDDHALCRALEKSDAGALVLKSQGGARGERIEFVAVSRNGGDPQLRNERGEVYDYAKLWAKCDRLGDWLLEERVRQHPSVSALYDGSVNTVRIVTLCYPDGETRILAALMRMGQKGSSVDNASAGGIHAHLDFERGQLLAPAYCKNDNATYAEHPDTGHPIAGFAVPYWDEVVNTVTRAAKRFVQTHTIAWDVAISERGPVVIEGNPTWNPGTMERGSYPKGDLIIAAAEAWKRSQHPERTPAGSGSRGDARQGESARASG